MCLPSGKQCNPGQSISRVLSTPPGRGWAIISLGRRSPAGSCSLPGTVGRAALPPRREMVPAWPCSGRGLPGRRITAAPVVSYTTLSPLLLRSGASAKRCISVARSGALRRPGGYPAPCPMERGLSSTPARGAAIARPT